MIINKLSENLNLRDFLKTEISNNKVFYKPAIILSMTSGFIYLNGYLSEYGIPFPLDIGVLASLLLVVGSLSIIFVAVILFYCLLVSSVNFFSSDPFGSNYHKVINLSKEGDYIPRMRNYVCFVFWFYLLPLISGMLLVIMVHKNFLNVITAYLLFLPCIISFLVYSFFFSKKVFKQKKEGWKFVGKMVVYYIICQLLSLASFVFFILLIAKQHSEISDLESIFIILAFLAINFFCLLPMSSNGKSNVKKNDVYTEDYLIEKPTFKHRWWLVILLIILSHIPAASPFVGELPLRLLNIGGGIDIVVVDNKEVCDSWPSFIISEADKTKDQCTTKEGQLLAQFGDRRFILFGDKVVNLKLSNSSIINDIPKETWYIKSKKKEAVVP